MFIQDYQQGGVLSKHAYAEHLSLENHFVCVIKKDKGLNRPNVNKSCSVKVAGKKFIVQAAHVVVELIDMSSEYHAHHPAPLD